jgi:hypothetical protein
VHTGEDATQEFMTLFADRQTFDEVVAKVVLGPLRMGAHKSAEASFHSETWLLVKTPDGLTVVLFGGCGNPIW